ncbi:MAG: LysR family transcriptional regulator [Actinomycetota bacterium]|jgi:DNA-binding transcriptional LysR family regulator|nr:LysR family transcriptional regulator [Actinomycetota bacterium]
MPLPEPVPDLVSLDLLDSVVQLGSIRRAAVAHGISQPAASMRLRVLERALGLALLDRSGGRATPTLAGEAVNEWGRRVLDATRDLLTGAEALRHDGRTQVRIAASMTVAEYLVPGWLQRMALAMPEVTASLQMGNSEQVAAVVAAGGADLGFVEGHAVPAGMESRTVVADELVVVVTPSHPWARRRRPVSADELARTPLVVRERGSGTRDVLETALGRLDLTVTARVELGSTTAIKTAIQSGTGPSVLSSLAVRAETEDGRLVVVPVADLALRRAIRAVWAEGRPLSRAAAGFLAAAGHHRAAGP